MQQDEDNFIFEDEEDGFVADDDNAPWVMLIVDDEPDVHAVTKLALNGFSYQGRSLSFLSAHSAAEALDILRSPNDIALILLDVVMESNYAGLDVARELRDEIGNDLVRIVLRTGQPGQAPEKDVILAYDINDYRAKTELSADRLFSTVVGALRNYCDLVALEEYREEAYKQLVESAQAVQSLIDLSADPLCQLNTDGTIRRCNQAFAALVGMDAEDMAGEALPTHVPSALMEGVQNQTGVRISLSEKLYDLQVSSQSGVVSFCLKGVE